MTLNGTWKQGFPKIRNWEAIFKMILYGQNTCDNLNWNFKEEEITLISVTRFNKGIHKHIFLTISFL